MTSIFNYHLLKIKNISFNTDFLYKNFFLIKQIRIVKYILYYYHIFFINFFFKNRIKCTRCRYSKVEKVTQKSYSNYFTHYHTNHFTISIKKEAKKGSQLSSILSFKFFYNFLFNRFYKSFSNYLKKLTPEIQTSLDHFT